MFHLAITPETGTVKRVKGVKREKNSGIRSETPVFLVENLLFFDTFVLGVNLNRDLFHFSLTSYASAFTLSLFTANCYLFIVICLCSL